MGEKVFELRNANIFCPISGENCKSLSTNTLPAWQNWSLRAGIRTSSGIIQPMTSIEAKA